MPLQGFQIEANRSVGQLRSSSARQKARNHKVRREIAQRTQRKGNHGFPDSHWSSYIRLRCRTVLRLDQPAIRCWHVLAHQLREIYLLNLSGQAQFFERPDSVPVDVNLVPFQTVTSRSRMRVVDIVPAFAECQQRNPPTVG